jgi:azurin
LRERSGEQVYLTPSIRQALSDLGLDQGLDNLAAQVSAEVTSVVAHRNEIGGGENMSWDFSPDFVDWYGSREINLAYYPTWPADKLIWISTRSLAEHDLFLRPAP